jgi:hypothetical protein
MKKIFVTAALLMALAASPALAQSYDPDLGTGNIVQGSVSTPSSGIYLRADEPAAPLGRTNAGRNGGGNTDARAAAIRECNLAARIYLDTTWGLMQSQQYRSCMARRGQVE